jgi:hypothetical protein
MMSDSYNIACINCGDYVWIGQSQNSDPPFCFYSGEPDTMQKLKEFLWKHMGHVLMMNESQMLEYMNITKGDEDD